MTLPHLHRAQSEGRDRNSNMVDKRQQLVPALEATESSLEREICLHFGGNIGVARSLERLAGWEERVAMSRFHDGDENDDAFARKRWHGAG